MSAILLQAVIANPADGAPRLAYADWCEREGGEVLAARVEILLTDGSTQEGVLDAEGSASVQDIDPGTCVVTFPGLDRDACEGI